MDTPSQAAAPQPTRHRRRIKLIRPRLQFKLVGAFLGLSTLAMGLQFLLFAAALSALSENLPQDGNLLMDAIPGVVLRTFAVTLCVMVPLIGCVGILVTFRVAGPVHRLENFLHAIVRGEKPPDCRLRQGDELQELCALVNQATAALRQNERVSPDGVPSHPRAGAADGAHKEAA